MTITAGGIVIAGADSGKVEDEQGFTLSFSDVDSVEPIIGADGPAMFRRKNRSASCSFSVVYEYATPAAAIAALMGWKDDFTAPVSVTFAESGTVLSLADALVTLANGSRQGCSVTIQWQITGRIA
jgi:hypothetical protein